MSCLQECLYCGDNFFQESSVWWLRDAFFVDKYEQKKRMINTLEIQFKVIPSEIEFDMLKVMDQALWLNLTND